MNNPRFDLLKEQCSGMWLYDDGWIRTFQRKVPPSSSGNECTMKNVHVIIGWAVGTECPGTLRQYRTPDLYYTSSKSYIGEVFERTCYEMSICSKFGELRVFTWRPLAFVSARTFLSLFYACAEWWRSCFAHARLSRSGFILNLLN